MNTKYIFSLVIAALISCNNQNTKTIIPINLNDSIPVYNFDELEPFLYTEKDKTIIVNFWAMWCAPCVAELPFLQTYANLHNEVELVLISQDFIENIESELKPFLIKNNITAKVILLDDPDANTWIDKIDPNWSGVIPFTIVFNNKKRVFFERNFEDFSDFENEMIKFNN